MHVKDLAWSHRHHLNEMRPTPWIFQTQYLGSPPQRGQLRLTETISVHCWLVKVRSQKCTVHFSVFGDASHKHHTYCKGTVKELSYASHEWIRIIIMSMGYELKDLLWIPSCFNHLEFMDYHYWFKASHSLWMSFKAFHTYKASVLGHVRSGIFDFLW